MHLSNFILTLCSLQRKKQAELGHGEAGISGQVTPLATFPEAVQGPPQRLRCSFATGPMTAVQPMLGHHPPESLSDPHTHFTLLQIHKDPRDFRSNRARHSTSDHWEGSSALQEECVPGPVGCTETHQTEEPSWALQESPTLPSQSVMRCPRVVHTTAPWTS